MRTREQARFWAHPALPGVDLLRASYVRHTFSRHAHDGYVIAAVTRGVEGVGLPGGSEQAGAGGVVLLNPEVPHSAYAGSEDGWSYRVLYPSTRVVEAVAADTGGPRGTPSFTGAVVADPAAARLVVAVHDSAEQDDALAAGTFLRLAIARLLERHGAGPVRGRRPGGKALRAAARARDLLAAHLADPPGLDDLAAATDTSAFTLLRAFKAAYGLPPHAWLTGERVRTARDLLDTGAAPADVAVTVGFTDQPHLNRHFSRIVGVPPGAYQRERGTTRHAAQAVRPAPGPAPARTHDG